MDRMALMPRRLLLAMTILAASLAGLALDPVRAQEGGPPPWPLLFSGTVTLDGAPVVSGAVTARLGDWETAPAGVIDGSLTCCLVVGPPDGTYVGLPVTFHLDGTYEATLTLDFPGGASPEERTVELVFTRTQLSPTPTPTREPSPTPTLAPPPTPTPIARVSEGPTVTPVPTGLGDEAGVTALVLIVLVVGGGVGLVAVAGLAAWRLYHRG